MPDKKLTDAEIVKVLECCSKPVGENCKECPLHLTDCLKVNIDELTLDLINRLQAENDSLYKTINNMASSVGKINEKLPLIIVEAYKEFAERLRSIIMWSPKNHICITAKDVEEILQGLVGDEE